MKITEPAEPISRLSVAACPCGARRQAQQAINAAILALSLAVSPCILLAEGDLPPLHEDPADDAEKQPVPEDIHHEPAPELAQEAEATLSVEEERDRIFRKDLVLRLNEIIEKVQTHHPALASQLSHDDKNRLLKDFAGSFNAGIEYLHAGERSIMAPQSQPRENSTVFPAIIMSSKKTLYIRMDSFSAQAMSQLEKDITSVFRLARPPSGFILDLRNSQGFGTDEALRALRLFVPANKIPAPPEDHSADKAEPQVKIPVLILVGHKTSGAAELFTFLLSSIEKAMPIGEKTAGNPFPRHREQLSNGDFLLVPQMPSFLPVVSYGQVSPAIKTDAYPQIDFDILRNTVGTEARDACLNRAVELLVCLHALTPESK